MHLYLFDTFRWQRYFSIFTCNRQFHQWLVNFDPVSKIPGSTRLFVLPLKNWNKFLLRVCVLPDRKPRRQVFSWGGSFCKPHAAGQFPLWQQCLLKLQQILLTWQNQQNYLNIQHRLRWACALSQSDQSSLSAWRRFGSLATHWVHS